MMIEKLDPNDSQDNRPEFIVAKINEIIEVVDRNYDPKQVAELELALGNLSEAYLKHVHYAREIQFPTSTPDNPNPFDE